MRAPDGALSLSSEASGLLDGAHRQRRMLAAHRGDPITGRPASEATAATAISCRSSGRCRRRSGSNRLRLSRLGRLVTGALLYRRIDAIDVVTAQVRSGVRAAIELDRSREGSRIGFGMGHRGGATTRSHQQGRSDQENTHLVHHYTYNAKGALR